MTWITTTGRDDREADADEWRPLPYEPTYGCPHCLPRDSDDDCVWLADWPDEAPMAPLPAHRDRYGSRPAWSAHAYHHREDDGCVVYVAEPYELVDRDLADLAQLAAAGWGVDVSASTGLHFPGRTLAVALFPPGYDHEHDDSHLVLAGAWS